MAFHNSVVFKHAYVLRNTVVFLVFPPRTLKCSLIMPFLPEAIET